VFELGRTFHRDGAGFYQPVRLGGLAYGSVLPEHWDEPSRPAGFFDVKGDLEALAAPRRLTTAAGAHPALHPGRAATVYLDGRAVGWLGELHPRLVQHFDLSLVPVVFEVDVAPLLESTLPCGQAVSRVPIVRRDLALVVDNSLPAQTLLDALDAAKPPHVIALEVFDVYRGPGLTDGKKSLAILVLMQDTSRTLTDADIDATEAALLVVAREKFGASLRN
jgi:phenylalanyl-tRNA synthetase beta chain